MANIQNEVVKVGETYVLKEILDSFNAMVKALQRDIGVTLSIKQGFVQKKQAIDEIRQRVKRENVGAELLLLVDETRSIDSIIADGEFQKLETLLNELQDTDFDPPLQTNGTQTLVDGSTVYSFPNRQDKDPRRSGKVIVPDPFDTFNQIRVQEWIVANGLNYGFILHGNTELYYEGFEAAATKIKAAPNPDQEFKKTVSKFVPSTKVIKTSNISSNNLTGPPNATSNSTSTTTVATTINGNVDLSNIPKIVNVNFTTNPPERRPVTEVYWWDGAAIAPGIMQDYMRMYQAAKKAGINLYVSSGFRPGFGSNFEGKTTKGGYAKVSSQEALRRDPAHWLGFPGSGQTQQQFVVSKGFNTIDQFVFNAPSTYFSPETAPPGTSKHGNGIALDINTGTRRPELWPPPKSFAKLIPENYKWLVKNSWKFNFVRTVGNEEWHFEHWPSVASGGPYSKIAGTEANRFYGDLGLLNLRTQDL